MTEEQAQAAMAWTAKWLGALKMGLTVCQDASDGDFPRIFYPTAAGRSGQPGGAAPETKETD